MSFISLKLDIISVESVVWVLKSLKNDEMTPSDKAIQSRLKEAFSFKTPTIIWEKIFIAIKNRSNFKHTNESYSRDQKKFGSSSSSGSGSFG
jgi:hypothetical protein